MKNLSLKAILIAVATLFAFNANAQDDPKKETVIVDAFTYSASASSGARDNVRSAVLTGFSNVGRFDVVDALLDSRLSALNAKRADKEEVVDDSNWQEESTNAYKALGATKLIKGSVELTSTYSKIDDNGKKWYYAIINYTVQVSNIETGAMEASESYKYEELSSSSYDDAFNDGFEKATREMTRFVNKHFPIETYILELGEADKKGVIKDLWISGGVEIGFAKGTVFMVQAEKKIGPKVTRVDVCKIVAKEASDGVTLCNIPNKKEAEVLKQKFNDGEKLIVVSVKQRQGLNGFFDAL